MKASYNWLRKLVPQLTASPEALAERLTAAGLEVEGIHRYGDGTASCIVAKVVSMRPHPSKSGLRLVTVDIGAEGQPEIVCGAPNVPDAGGLVVLAPLGTHLPAVPMTIARREIGGIVSEGMLCSEGELGLSADSSGIMVLAKGSATAGAPFLAAVPEASDHILEIGLTPNRPDCLGHVGLAREIAALYSFPFVLPTSTASFADTAIESLGAKISLSNLERCSRYAAAVALDVKVGPSPLWLRYRLSSLGVRPISNLVDLTNLVMFEWGHPMHAFDLDKLAEAADGTRISVRLARIGETLITLDGQERTLAADDLVICDGVKPVALAGVMGGADSEVSATTTRVLFEVANFDPRSVRRTARRFGLHSEASHRFERGVDPNDVDAVLASAAGWLTRLGAGKCAKGIADARDAERAPKSVTLRHARMAAILGVSVALTEASAILQRLGCTRLGGDAHAIEVSLPSHRPDLTREIDLIEEVIRVRGIDTVPAVIPTIAPTQDVGGREAFVTSVRNACVSLGLSEAILLGMTSPEALAQVNAPAAAVSLQNGLSERAGVMRTSLLPGLFSCVNQAFRHGVTSARLFATGAAFFAPSAASASPALPTEKLTLAIVLTGERSVYLAKAAALDVWDAKGIAEALLFALTGRQALLSKDSAAAAAEGVTNGLSHLHPRGRAYFSIDGITVGRFGVVHPDVLERVEISAPTTIIELDLDALRALPAHIPTYRALPKYPANSRDVAVVVRDVVTAGDVVAAIKDAGGDLLESAAIFDRFEGASVPEGHQSLAFHVLYRIADRTLTDAEVDARHEQVVRHVSARFGAQLRGV